MSDTCSVCVRGVDDGVVCKDCGFTVEDFAGRDATIARLRKAIETALVDLGAAYRHWDADHDSKVGKCISSVHAALKAALAAPPSDAPKEKCATCSGHGHVCRWCERSPCLSTCPGGPTCVCTSCDGLAASKTDG